MRDNCYKCSGQYNKDYAYCSTCYHAVVNLLRVSEGKIIDLEAKVLDLVDKLSKEKAELSRCIDRKGILERRVEFLRLKWQPEINGDTADTVILQAADGHRFPVNLLILGSHSRVFDTMLRVDMVEKTRRKVEIDDMYAPTLRSFIDFLYSADTSMEELEKYSAELLLAAHKYEVDLLSLTCQEFMLTNINAGTVFSYMEAAHLSDSKAVKLAAFTFLKANLNLPDLDEKLLTLATKYPQLAVDILKFSAARTA